MPYLLMENSMIKKIDNTETATALFSGWNTALIWSCLQKTMGEIYADDATHPTAAMAILGDFVFFAGIPNKELISYKPVSCHQDFIIMVPQNDTWFDAIEQCYQTKAKKVLRYATKKEPYVFNKEKLQQVVSLLPQEYSLKPIDEAIYNQCNTLPWCHDLISQYSDYTAYHRSGLGFVILQNGVPISGASSYAHYMNGIEIQIDTNERYRRRGLAYICGAQLIIACLEKNLYPSWDAQNIWSVVLAEKLGYHYSHTYTAYEICEY